MTPLSTLCGAFVIRTESRRLPGVPLDDQPLYDFAVVEDGSLWSLTGLSQEEGDAVAESAIPIAQAPIEAQRAAVCLGHVILPVPELEEQGI